jgi:tetratricopeptide (TPR) repeat protein
LDYAEYLGIIEDGAAVREIARDVERRFPDARGYRALARLNEVTGDVDIGIAWALKAYREQPSDDDTRGQLGELYARIGLFDAAAEYDPGPHMYQLYYEGRYQELIDLAQEEVLDNPADASARYMLAFAYNAEGYFEFARVVLQQAGMPVEAGAEYGSGGAEAEALASYVDALQGLDPDDPRARELALQRLGNDTAVERDTTMAKSWWSNALQACTRAQLGHYAETLDRLDRIKDSQGLAWSPMLRDSPCFKPLVEEARYQELLAHLEERQAILRARLPDTLRAHGVADVRPL